MDNAIENILAELKPNQLLALHYRIPEVLAQKQKEIKQILTEKFREMAAEAGLSFENIIWEDDVKLQKLSKQMKHKKQFRKYRNPADPNQIWEGKGKRPVWVRKWIDSGRKMEEIEIV